MSEEHTGNLPLQFWDDATWILTNAFIIFTMQSGFGLLESGSVGPRNEVNIMVKNAVDVVFGGLSYWMFGFGLSFGEDPGVNWFSGWGYWFVDLSPDNPNMGFLFATFIFQLSFATTATTIVSGAMAERTKLTAYLIFSFFNTVVYCFPSHWMWAPQGFLFQMGAIDIAGSGVVHLVGGVSGLVATMLLKPRVGRYDNGLEPPPMGKPTNSIVGMFMLWWGWLAFNCGSTFGVSGGKWQNAAKSAVTTILGSMAGGVVGIAGSYPFKGGKCDVGWLVNGVLGGLVAITASCAVVSPIESIVIGGLGAVFALGTIKGLDYFHIDDPVGAVGVHGTGGAWGILAVGLFASVDRLEDITSGRNGLFHGGGFYLFGVQTLAVVAFAGWAAVTTLILLYVMDRIMGLRVTPVEERLGADAFEHDVFLATSFEEVVEAMGDKLRPELRRRAGLPEVSHNSEAKEDGQEIQRETASPVEFPERSLGQILMSLVNKKKVPHDNDEKQKY